MNVFADRCVKWLLQVHHINLKGDDMSLLCLQLVNTAQEWSWNKLSQDKGMAMFLDLPALPRAYVKA